MTEKTQQQLIDENERLTRQLELQMALNKERETSDAKYAPMITKTIVFGIVGTAALFVLYAVLAKIGLPNQLP